MFRKLVDILFGGMAGSAVTAYICGKKHEKAKHICDRNKYYLDLVSTWLSNKNAGKSMQKFLINKDIKSIAIYGVGTMGELFYEEVENTEIVVRCFVDKSAGEGFTGADGIPVITMKKLALQTLPDAVIITPMAYYDNIVKDIESSGIKTKVFSLEEMIYNMI